MPPQYRLQIGAININSNRTASYDSKVQHLDFNYLTQGLDVIGLSETHAATEQEVQIHGYCHFSIVRKKATLAPLPLRRHYCAHIQSPGPIHYHV